MTKLLNWLEPHLLVSNKYFRQYRTVTTMVYVVAAIIEKIAKEESCYFNINGQASNSTRNVRNHSNH